jgi:hypothetical protein
MTDKQDASLSEAEQDAYVQWVMEGAEGMSARDLLRAAHAASESGMKEDAETIVRTSAAVSLLDTEPRTADRFRLAVGFGELILCMAETNENATADELEALEDALSGSSLSELVHDVIEGMRA